MPTGETPTPEFQRGEDLPYGQADAANNLMALIPLAGGPEEHQASSPQEEFLFSQTDRPAEPMTAGAPFGEGVGPAPSPSDDARADAVVTRALNDPNAPRVMKQFAQRQLEGM